MIQRFSSLVSSGVPCFFYTDFTGEHIHCYTLDELKDEDIEFAFNSDSNRTNSPHKPSFFPICLENYRQKFDAVQEHIRRGNSYLLNLTQPTPLESPYTLKEIYTMAHAPYKLRVKDQFVCFSPEPFITIEENTIHTYPMKGTIDASIPNAIETILNDPKEFAEHTMIVDLLRNDLGIVAKNIKVETFRYITTIDTGDKKLHQVSSHISGLLHNNWKDNIGELVLALLPAGSISGTPKRKTVEIIEEVEGYKRGYFTGVFGHFDGKNLYSAVAIRFIENKDGNLIYKSGGGITADSICEGEYKEMLDKIYIP
ncbi:MAG: aminodeoxychorismate synthase component I [Sulfuricurvum sp. GWF2_44_89]|uniref:Aminodeoxychorismate synthase component I n=1 Tax=Sulfuricurvum kujiense TaxID=148813 RepID=A0A2D3WGL9_9BACT|nr:MULTISPECIES: aminodeoxychorismate synthase component I [Sulfuricurvum]OHD79042.1 MAG: aminodeoxychorismate synthase component I [Sulfuricurvum sp. GWF2_44_89]OHD93444.1 MAG: aminodeoxychorismate synthase component I [Sulfuricurvum sp. RIFOXYD12_FULL_44_77]OHD97112.1 MAG: aminodeoxychorismate synthase component I [Sulfuricurvum sp. RIFOXYD2_FULL_44_160]DAB37426.1 MAG TPA: aminodeoxychorismate synthase component I [Sulfuricurvum kujiense]